MTPYGQIVSPIVPPPTGTPPVGDPTPLSAAAQGMVAGELKKLRDVTDGTEKQVFNGMNLGVGPIFLCNFGPNAVWDSSIGELHFIGRAHQTGAPWYGKHFKYSEVDDLFSEVSLITGQPAGPGSHDYSQGGNFGHCYHNSAMVEREDGTREIWHKPFNSIHSMFRYTGSGYAEIPKQPSDALSTNGPHFGGIEFFPERNTVVVQGGQGADGVLEWDLSDETTNTWVRTVSGFNPVEFTPGPSNDSGCLHSPINGGAIYFGGGRGDEGYGPTLTSWFKADGTYTKLEDSPINYANNSNTDDWQFVDHRSGNLVVFKDFGGSDVRVYEYDPRRDSLSGMSPGTGGGWQRFDGTGGNPDYETNIAPLASIKFPEATVCAIPEYNVVMIVQVATGVDYPIWLYRHSV